MSLSPALAAGTHPAQRQPLPPLSLLPRFADPRRRELDSGSPHARHASPPNESGRPPHRRSSFLRVADRLFESKPHHLRTPPAAGSDRSAQHPRHLSRRRRLVQRRIHRRRSRRDRGERGTGRGYPANRQHPGDGRVPRPRSAWASGSRKTRKVLHPVNQPPIFMDRKESGRKDCAA